MAPEKDNFEHSGPKHLTTVDWTNPCHRRSVAACLVRSVSALERDRLEDRKGNRSLAPPWWRHFGFQLCRRLTIDGGEDSCVFGAIYQLTTIPSDNNNHPPQAPRYVVALRGTITKRRTFFRDLKYDIRIILDRLDGKSRSEIVIQAVRDLVDTTGSNDIWLAGHSLGAAMVMLAGKNMAKSGVSLDAFLFNPPFFSAPIERIKQEKVKDGLRIAKSGITAGLAFAIGNNDQASSSGGSFVALSGWLPSLFVNPSDHFCSEYIGYFEHRKLMEENGGGGIERVASQHSIRGLLFKGKQSVEPLRLLPSATLTVNRTPARDFKDAHGIQQWWRHDLHLESKIYNYK